MSQVLSGVNSGMKGLISAETVAQKSLYLQRQMWQNRDCHTLGQVEGATRQNPLTEAQEPRLLVTADNCTECGESLIRVLLLRVLMLSRYCI